MANRALFDTRTVRVPEATTKNVAGGAAYELGAKVELAQLACTGTLGDAFYTSADDQLTALMNAASQCEAEWVGRVAAYARKHGHMKDAPSVLIAWLALSDSVEFERWAPLVIDNGRMVRNVVQMLRSTRIMGQKSLPRPVRRYLRDWINARKTRALVNDSVGTNPSIGDVIKMVRPKPNSSERRALYGYLIGRDDFEADALPQIARELRWFHIASSAGETEIHVPPVDFRLLTGREIKSKTVWRDIALAANWHALRMNLATFKRHGVLDDAAVAKRLAEKLADPETVRRVRVWPTQLWSAYKIVVELGVPRCISGAIQDALEISVESVPKLEGGVILCPDDSGSMMSPLTGRRGSATTSVSCAEMAALMSFAMLRQNEDAEILKFSSSLERWRGNPRDPIVTLMGQYHCRGGGTNMSLPLIAANQEKWMQQHIWYIGDNATWMDSTGAGMMGWTSGTQMQAQLAVYRKRVPNVRTVYINLQPYGTAPATGDDVLNIGGFADTVFQTAATFAREGKGPEVWIRRIESIQPPN